MQIVRLAIKNYPLHPDQINFPKETLSSLEEKIFLRGIELLKANDSAEVAISKQSVSTSFPNNVVLIDIFATMEDKKNSKNLSIKEDGNKKGFAETHTVCLWKRTDTQFMIIDPSSSQMSERLEKECAPIFHQEFKNAKCNIIEHPESQFYTLPEKASIVNKSTTSEKMRDCIDMALKIGIVLNQGIRLYDNAYQLQNSINLLSNRSAVNPILGNMNDCTFIKKLQSTRSDIRTKAITYFSNIPPIFKQFFKYDAWLQLTDKSSDQQAAVLKALTVFNKELSTGKFFEDKKIDFDKQIARLQKLANYCDRFTNLRRDLQQENVLINVVLNGNAFISKT